MASVYATAWHAGGSSPHGELADYLRLWRYGQYYTLSADQLPAVLRRDSVDLAALTFRRWTHPERLTGAQIWLFALPSGQIRSPARQPAAVGTGR